jgi:SAM-dependent methyltransferase
LIFQERNAQELANPDLADMSATRFSIRPYRATDRPGVRQIYGQDEFARPRLMGKYPRLSQYLADEASCYFTDYEPESLLVAKFPPASVDAVVSFYTLEHIPRKEHAAILKKINQWLRNGGFLLISLEAGDQDDVMGQWLGVPMFFSCYEPETVKQMVIEAGFGILETAIETQLENDDQIPYLWVLGCKR